MDVYATDTSTYGRIGVGTLRYVYIYHDGHSA